METPRQLLPYILRCTALDRAYEPIPVFFIVFLLAKLFSDLDNPDCLDFPVNRNKNLK